MPTTVDDPGRAATGDTIDVLVVISDAAVRERAVSALGLRPDIEVTAVTSIHDAVEHLPGAEVLVVDGDLQPKGGYSWLYELQQQSQLTGLRRPPSVVLIERTDDRFLVNWSGAEAAVVKPVDPFVMVRTVGELATAGAAA